MNVFSLRKYFKFLLKWFFILVSVVLFIFLIIYTIRLEKKGRPSLNPYIFRGRPNMTNVYSNEISLNSANLNKTMIMDYNKLEILFYGLFYDHLLFPELIDGYCSKSPNHSILRRESCASHDVVILHFDNYKRFIKNCPISKNSSKKFMIIYFMEPPFSTKRFFDNPPSSEHYHILTNSYHQESMFRSAYFHFIKKENFSDLDILLNEFTSRRRSAFAAISACRTSTTIRLEYVEILGNHFRIEKYGDCFGHQISSNKYTQVMKEAMFFLDFENYMCKDYITEKYCIPLIHGAIPIVLSHPKNYAQLIPGSYLNPFDFESPQDFAKHLTKISKNFTMYKSFFDWKQHYHLDLCDIGGDVCQMINEIHNFKMSPDIIPTDSKTLTDDSNCLKVPEMRKLLLPKNQ